MPLTDKEYSDFKDKIFEISKRYDVLYKDKERFIDLIYDKDFAEENVSMFRMLTDVWLFKPDPATPEDLDLFLQHYNAFVEKWETIPLSIWFFQDYVRAITKEEMEAIFDSISEYHVIKVYPWTTQQEVKSKYGDIKKRMVKIKLTPETYANNFKIKALRDEGWKWDEISDFLLMADNADNNTIAKKINAREEELRSKGLNVADIDKILDQEFPPNISDATLSFDEAARKRKQTADKLCNDIMSYILKPEAK